MRCLLVVAAVTVGLAAIPAASAALEPKLPGDHIPARKASPPTP